MGASSMFARVGSVFAPVIADIVSQNLRCTMNVLWGILASKEVQAWVAWVYDRQMRILGPEYHVCTTNQKLTYIMGNLWQIMLTV